MCKARHIMKQSHLEALREANSESELKSALLEVGFEMGFGLGSIGFRKGKLGEAGSIRSITNAPQEWLSKATDPLLGADDPVLVRAMGGREPFFYDQEFYAKAGKGDLWDDGSPFGYANGVSASLHLPGDRTLVWGFDGHAKLPGCEERRTRLLADTQLIGMYFASAAERILWGVTAVLTETQSVVLKHTRDGHPAWKIAHFMGITEDTVNYHLKQCRGRLGVSNKHQAVLKAIELGLLT